jgi:hypothetical protein
VAIPGATGRGDGVIATFAAVLMTLYIAHSVGDQWVQTHAQALAKGTPGWTGRVMCAGHVATLTLTKMAILGSVATIIHLPLSGRGVIVGLGVDAASHYWADRRTTLAKLATRLGKGEYAGLGTAAHPLHPVTADGSPAVTLGTGAYQLDQSWHHAWLLVAALIITVL